MKIKRMLAVISALSMVMSFAACGKKGNGSSDNQEGKDSSEITAENSTNSEEPDISGQEIYWLSDYDLNPEGESDRSISLALFEDIYGGKINYVATTHEKKYDDLSNRLLGGEPVDMFPYESGGILEGINNDQFQPLDDYINLDDELWTGMKDTADSMMYNGAHYIIPYSISDPMCIIYSRAMIKDEGLDDPAELYKKGEWDWDAFMSMMETFVDNGGGETRYGCIGWIGQALVQSTGHTIVNYDGSKLTNNIEDADIEKAELALEKINEKGYYNSQWQSYFPTDGSTLFYGMSPWALAESNGKNPDGDIFLVPFPKEPGSDKYYLSGSFDAKMLVAGSDKGDAVAAYIKCERIAATEKKYTDAVREKALVPEVNTSGEKVKYITEEQYDAWQELTNPENITPVFDFGFEMGSAMTGETYEYETRGAMKNITDGLISDYEGSPSTWNELRDAWKSAVDDEIAKYK